MRNTIGYCHSYEEPPNKRMHRSRRSEFLNNPSVPFGGPVMLDVRRGESFPQNEG
jgi:hypothetical protein